MLVAFYECNKRAINKNILRPKRARERDKESKTRGRKRKSVKSEITFVIISTKHISRLHFFKFCFNAKLSLPFVQFYFIFELFFFRIEIQTMELSLQCYAVGVRTTFSRSFHVNCFCKHTAFCCICIINGAIFSTIPHLHLTLMHILHFFHRHLGFTWTLIFSRANNSVVPLRCHFFFISCWCPNMQLLYTFAINSLPT